MGSIPLASNELEVNGERFISLELAPKTESKIIQVEVCDKPNKDFNNDFDAINLKTNDLVFAANIAATGLAAYQVQQVSNDKGKHFLVGYVIGSTVTGASQLFLPQKMKHRKLVSALIGFGASVLIGTGKELYDARHPASHTADKYDALATFAGGAAGTVAISFTDVKKVFTRKK